MTSGYSVTLDKIVKEFSLEIVANGEELDKIKVVTSDINRPATQLGGFFDYYDNKRIQIIGNVETAFLAQFDSETRAKSYQTFFASKPVAVIVARNLYISPEMKAAAIENGVPLLRTGKFPSRSHLRYSPLCECKLHQDRRSR